MGVHRQKSMKEEHLRAHFLVQLNGQYEGLATGETFNLKGKTDIYLPFKERTAFIAECKFWQGQQGLLDALDQLLGYTIWPNTKVALLIFNQRKGFTDVLRKIKEGLPQHPNFKEELSYAHRRGVRVLFRRGDDQERELIIIVLAFDIPGAPRVSTNALHCLLSSASRPGWRPFPSKGIS